MLSSGHTDIWGCRKERSDYRCQSKSSGNVEQPMERQNRDSILVMSSHLAKGILAVSVIHLVVAFVHLLLYSKKEFDEKTRSESDICLRKEETNACLTYDEYKLVFESACGSLGSDDPTYKTMTRNFDDGCCFL